MNFFKTIRFKLTLWYSLLLIVLNLVFVLAANFIITQHYQDRLPRFLNNNTEYKLPPSPVPMLQQASEREYIRKALQQARENDLVQIQKILYLTFALLVGLSFGGGYIIAGRMLKPLQKINTATKEITAHNLDTQISHQDTGDEMSELINNINNMIARLNNAFALQKQFIENASHELKTPLAIIKTNLDAAVLSGAITEQEVSNYVQCALKSTSLMSKLIEDLLLLSLAEKDIQFTKLDVKQILQDSVQQLTLLANDKHIKIKTDITTRAVVLNGNAALLQRAFMNIIENAIYYSKATGDIMISLVQQADGISVCVKDNGIGIPADKLAKVFNRFYRVDVSRSKKTGGSGLGLAITKRIIELHQGQINITSKLNDGTTVVIQLTN
ncbi:MAG: HAMP domain-containing sensor histidine kinase [Patescibacteria group bacterium]|jgi:signal transduction histidine kinase